MNEIKVKYTKSISTAVEKELKKLVNKNILPVFDLWETVEQEGKYIVKLMLSSKKFRNIQVIKEFPSIIDQENKQVILYI
ncbi:hypothetical protein [Bacillus xiapuensis]|uniref:Uncharacterized protein n=1 Tax=Bacillus xiapuensis TaxID=2014075 RepID=A0ABU6N7U2_9BACI|nr:hypothetical protein [Bacillus xiapuensis]